MTARKSCVALAAAFGLLADPAVAQQVTTYVYDALGRVVTATYPNGATVSYTYDNADNRTRALTTGAMAAASGAKVRVAERGEPAPKVAVASERSRGGRGGRRPGA